MKITILLVWLISLSSALFGSTLRVNPANGRYFTDDSGQSILLTGSHTWNNLQDSSSLDSFDFNAYLTSLVNNNHNFIRLWQLDGLRLTLPGGAGNISPIPFLRTGPGNASDGGPKLDLTQLDNAFFNRLYQRVADAQAQGIYISIMLFDSWWVTGSLREGWRDSYYNPVNNINGIHVTPHQVYTLANPDLLAVQEAYVKRVIDTVNGFDNVLYEITNEAPRTTKDWQYHMINLIHTYEAGKPKQHPVGMTSFDYPSTYAIVGEAANIDLYNSPADWVSPWGGVSYPDDMPIATGNKIVILDTDHVWGFDPPGDDSLWFWKSFLRGHNPILMDSYGNVPAFPTDPAERAAMGQVRRYATKMNLNDMSPQNFLSSSGYILANTASPAAEYITFTPASTVSVDLSASFGDFSIEWFNPSSGVITSGGTVAGGAVRHFTTPSLQTNMVLYLKNVVDAAGTSPAPRERRVD
jgi:hypothetical protein